MEKPRQIHYATSSPKISFNQITSFSQASLKIEHVCAAMPTDSTNQLTQVWAKPWGIKVRCLKNQVGVWSVLLNQGEGMRTDLCTHSQVITLVQKCQRQGRRSNHRMAYIGRDLKDHLTPTPCNGQGCHPPDQAAQGPLQTGLECFQG